LKKKEERRKFKKGGPSKKGLTAKEVHSRNSQKPFRRFKGGVEVSVLKRGTRVMGSNPRKTVN